MVNAWKKCKGAIRTNDESRRKVGRCKDLQRSMVCLTEEKKKKKKKKEKEEDEEGSQAGTKEGEEALRFFRGRDFETCLSALKSREIKEPRPKPGEHV
jgi:hypothetical protein